MKKALAKASAFFNEIRLRRCESIWRLRQILLRSVKYASHVKCASRVRRRISFHIATEGSNISQFPKEIISHFAARQNISRKTQGFESLCPSHEKSTCEWAVLIRKLVSLCRDRPFACKYLDGPFTEVLQPIIVCGTDRRGRRSLQMYGDEHRCDASYQTPR